MTLNISDLPRRFLYNCCTFLDDTTLASMREVNKFAEALLNEFIIDVKKLTKSSVVHRFSIDQEGRRCVVFIGFVDDKVDFSWLIYLNYMDSILDFPDDFDRTGAGLRIRLGKPRNLKKFLDLLIPFMEKAKIMRFECNCNCIVDPAPFKSIYDFIRTTNPSTVELLYFKLTEDSTDFLLRVSDIVESLEVKSGGEHEDDGDHEQIPPSLMMRVLKRKCSKLITDTLFTKKDAETFLQYFHYSGKKVYCVARSEGRIGEMHVGKYHVFAIHGPGVLREGYYFFLIHHDYQDLDD